MIQYFIDGKLINPEKTPVIICCENDADVTLITDDLMRPRLMDGPKFHGQFPNSVTAEEQQLIMEHAKKEYFTSLVKEKEDA